MLLQQFHHLIQGIVLIQRSNELSRRLLLR
jgi:hypothetical protein